MSIPRGLVPAVVLLAAIAFTLAYMSLTPEVIAFSPLASSSYLSKTTEIEITFSREMDPDSVMDRLSIIPRVAGRFTWEGETLRFVPAEGWKSGVQVRVRLAGGAKSKLGLATREGTAWRFTISPALLAYLWPAHDLANVFALDPDSGEIQQLTAAGSVLSYDVGPEGRLIYYSALNQQGGSDIYVLERFQGVNERVLSCGGDICTDLAVSPLNGMIAFLKNDSEVWLYRLDDEGAEMVSPKGHESRLPQWSPYGHLGYYDAADETFIVFNVDTGRSMSLENLTGEVGTWSPRGTTFVAPETFTKVTDILRGPTGEAAYEEVDEEELEPVRVLVSRLLSYDPDTGKATNLTSEDYAEDLAPAFSPNGRWLVFARRYLDEAHWTPGRQAWLLHLGSGDAFVLTHAPEYKYTSFAWHPQSEKFAAVRFNATHITDPPELWLIETDGGAVQLVIGGYAPQWIP